MPSDYFALDDHTGDLCTFTVVGTTARGASFKDTTRALALPLSLDINFIVGAPGTKANDKLVVTFRNSVINDDTAEVSTGSAKLEVSVPRDTAAWTGDATENLLAFVSDLLSDSGRRASIADGMVP